MSTWQPADLEQVSTNPEVTLAVDKRDGTAGNPVIIWAVVVDNQAYVRADYGEQSPWFRRALEVQQGTFATGSLTARVTIQHATDIDQDVIDDAFRQKYITADRPNIDSTVTPVARASTLRLKPIQ